MQAAQAPIYIQVIQWADAIGRIIYQIALPIILVLAYVELRKLVKRLAPKAKAEKAEEKA